jgi:hypothetical protein
MAISTAHMPVSELMGRVTRGELRLPEIQRGYVWKPPQVAKLLDSLYREFPSGSLLLWEAESDPETRAMRTSAGTQPAAQSALYLLDGQQRLTSLHRVFSGHPDANIVFNVETEAFQNQSGATRQDPRWLRVHDLLHGTQIFQLVGGIKQALPTLDEQLAFDRITRVHRIKDYRYYLETLRELSYMQVTDIFVRVNSRGRTLRATDLALATLSARWPGVLRKFEEEGSTWGTASFPDLDTGFLTRAMTAALLGRGLSQWSLGRLTAATDEALEAAWATVRRGLKHLVPLLKNNLGVQHSSLLPSVLALVPLVVLLGERPDAPLGDEERDAVLYWLLAATILNRYSGSTDTVLGQDIPAVRKPDGIKALLDNLGLLGGRVTVTPEDLAGRGQGSPYFFLSFLVAKRAGATDWWFGSAIDATAQGSQKLQYHHVHPRATLKNTYSKQEINDLANLAFISGRANLRISDRTPERYFPELLSLGAESLAKHFVPDDPALRTADAYPAFVLQRRALLAEAMTSLLDSLAPPYLGSGLRINPLTGSSLDLQVYESDWDEPKILVHAIAANGDWRCVLALNALEQALEEAAQGVVSDLALAGTEGLVRPADNGIEVELGPFIVEGTREDWQLAIDRERADALPLSQLPQATSAAWDADRTRFPIASSE